ncbi:type VI secretion system-associated protein TagO [Achromobacter sp.]|uniref:type VI secretion system-associated protein TagO n=1 Tax=Achromobacter sp. TaxID=134375 RepID=UPI00257E5D83
MKLATPLVLLMLAAPAGQAADNIEASARECTAIVSAVERLACFDLAAGTPPAPSSSYRRSVAVDPTASSSTAPANQAASDASAQLLPPSTRAADIVRQNEAARTEGDRTFLISDSNEPPSGQQRVVISAPALNMRPPIYLAITCLSNISRLQLLTERPFERHQMTVQLYMDDRPLSPARPWRVLDEGNVADAGRGLVAIEQLRPFVAGTRLRLESDYAPVNGLAFDATGLQALLSRQREACHW